MKAAEIEISYKNMNSKILKIDGSKSAYEVLISNWNKNQIEILEEFYLLMLNNSNVVIGIYPLSKGGRTATIVDLKILFSVALKCNSTALILAHNHPSGILKPSKSDKEITRKIIEAGKILELNILDHLILSKSEYFSFSDNGLIKS